MQVSPACFQDFSAAICLGRCGPGFLGAMLAGLVAGYVVEGLKKIPVSRYLRPIMPILVIPILAGGLIGVLMIKVLGVPIALFMDHANHALDSR